MPKTNLPSYRLHKSSGQAIVVLRGKTIYLGKYKSKASREKYDDEIAKYLANGKKLPSTRSRKEISVEELAVGFLDWADGYYIDEDGNRTMTAEHCRLALAQAVRFYGRDCVSNFGPLSLKFIRDKMIEEGYPVKRKIDGELVEQREKYTRETINARINIIRQAFRWGVENELVPPDVSHALDAIAKLKKGRTAAKDNDDVPPVPNEIVDATLPFVSPIIADMIQIQRFCGGRPQDVCNLRACDIDRTGDVWEYRPDKYKTKYMGKNRVLVFGPKAQEILLPYLGRKLDDEYIFSPTDSTKRFRERQRETRKTPVQPSQIDRSKPKPKRKPGKQYSQHSYRQAIHRACKKNGIERWSPNQIRHSAATEVTAMFGLEAAKEFLGHTSIKTTEKHYVAPIPELASKVARKIG